jgi:hypothetical protein
MAPDSEDVWYYLDHINQVQGPYSKGVLGSILEESGDYPVLRPGMTTWSQASLLPEFAHLAPETMDDKDDARAGRFARGFIMTRSLDEMLGVCKGVLADGSVVELEAIALEEWCRANPEVSAEWPANVLAGRLRTIFEDGIVGDEERAELQKLLELIVGGPPEAAVAQRLATKLPLDNPAPSVRIRGSSFCFTGKFIYGTRKVCENAVAVRGGLPKKSVYSDTDFLIVGTMATEAWVHGIFGRKIEEAITRRAAGSGIRIVSEEHWTRFLL